MCVCVCARALCLCVRVFERAPRYNCPSLWPLQFAKPQVYGFPVTNIL